MDPVIRPRPIEIDEALDGLPDPAPDGEDPVDLDEAIAEVEALIQGRGDEPDEPDVLTGERQGPELPLKAGAPARRAAPETAASPRDKAWLTRLIERQDRGEDLDCRALGEAMRMRPGPAAVAANRLVNLGYLVVTSLPPRRTWRVAFDGEGRPVPPPPVKGTRIEVRDGQRVTICPPRWADGARRSEYER